MGRVIKRGELETPPVSISKDAVAAAKVLVDAKRAALRIREEAGREVIELAIHMARRIVGRVALNPSVLNEIYRQALTKARDFERAEVIVHPLDRKDSIIDSLARQNGFVVREDPTLDRGGCRICAGGVELDATVATALSLFEYALKGGGSDAAN